MALHRNGPSLPNTSRRKIPAWLMSIVKSLRLSRLSVRRHGGCRAIGCLAPWGCLFGRLWHSWLLRGSQQCTLCIGFVTDLFRVKWLAYYLYALAAWLMGVPPAFTAWHMMRKITMRGADNCGHSVAGPAWVDLHRWCTAPATVESRRHLVGIDCRFADSIFHQRVVGGGKAGGYRDDGPAPGVD